jgi:hypothetical protein
LFAAVDDAAAAAEPADADVALPCALATVGDPEPGGPCLCARTGVDCSDEAADEAGDEAALAALLPLADPAAPDATELAPLAPAAPAAPIAFPSLCMRGSCSLR